MEKWKDFAEYIKAVRIQSETGVKDPRLGKEIKQDFLTEEEMDKLKEWANKRFKEIINK